MVQISKNKNNYGKSTFYNWIENYIQIILGVRNQLIEKKLCSDTIINNAVNELRKFQNNKKASVYFYWNRAKAQK